MERKYSKMKKILTVVLMIAMVMSLTLAVSAEVGGFIQSPSNNHAPTLVEGANIDPGCIAQVIITAYIDRHELPTEKLLLLEEAYRIIAENPDLSALNSTLVELAAELGISVSDLAVSDMFDISATDCDEHDGHGHFDITLKADTLANFVCLLHYYKGVWSIVDGATVTEEGTHLEFDVKEFSPFAIVVNTNPDAKAGADTDIDADADANIDTDTDVAVEEPEKTLLDNKRGLYMLVGNTSGVALLGLVVAYKKSKS